MSWSAYGTIGPKEEVKYTSETLQTGIGDKESEESLKYAKKLAQEIVKSGIVGSPKGTFRVALNGHSNDDYRTKSGLANDFITISITQEERA